MFRIKLLKFIFAFLCLPFVLLSQENGFQFNYVSLEQGLSQNSIYSIFQDSRGFMWFATEDGLERYDGINIKHFKLDSENPNSLSGNFIRQILEYPEGTLWIGTDGGGLNKLDLATESVTRFKHDPQNSNSISSDEIRALHLDSEKTLWIGTDGGGLNKMNPETGEFKRFDNNSENPNSIPTNRIWGLYEDMNGAVSGAEDILWIATNREGLVLFDKNSEKFYHFKKDEFSKYRKSKVNSLGISENKFKDFLSKWKEKNL